MFVNIISILLYMVFIHQKTKAIITIPAHGWFLSYSLGSNILTEKGIIAISQKINFS
jgi:hypothetical protein